jgi:charged multivesicular body protein 7
MRSYESSTATLRAILAHPSLQREKIDETMDAMASAQADAKEIDDAIRMGADMAHADTSIDDSELEAELNALIRETEEEKASAERIQPEEKQMRLSAENLKVPVDSPLPSNVEAETMKVAKHA